MISTKNLLRSAIVAAAVAPAVTLASGYKINEQSAAGMGTAHAGRSAMAEDASVVFYNPAAMTQLDKAQISGGFTYINGYGDFRGESQNAAQFPSAGEGFNDGGNFLGEKFIPFFYYANPISDKLAVGLGVYTPFGTSTDYDDNFVGAQFADETSLISLELQPSIAYKVNDQLSIGGGLDIIYMEGTLSKSVDLIPFNSQVPGLDNPNYIGFENHYEVTGDDWGVGWNIAMFYQLSEKTNLGLTYRSEIDVDLEGDSAFAEQQNLAFYDSDSGTIVNQFPTAAGAIPVSSRDQASKVPLTTPASATLSVTHQLNDQLLLQAGATWTGWSSFQNFDVIGTENTEAGFTDGFADPSDLAQLGNGYIGHIDESWVDVWAVALGATYKLNDQIKLRAGYAFDESPVRDEYRTARVPSSDRQWFTVGMNYAVSSDLSFDVAAGHLLMYPMDVNEYNKTLANEQKDNAELNGEYEIDVFGLALQANYQF